MNTTSEIRCNGFCLQPNFDFSKEGAFELDNEINRQRAAFKLAHETEFGQYGLYEDGPRFRDNKSVRARINSACLSLLHFQTFQTEWIQAALDDCARADHWYRFEKEYE